MSETTTHDTTSKRGVGENVRTVGTVGENVGTVGIRMARLNGQAVFFTNILTFPVF